MEAENLRSLPRHPREYRVEYSVLSGEGILDVFPAHTLDFSVDGARIETSRALKKGDRLSVRFELPDLKVFTQDEQGRRHHKNTVMMCFGEVRWANEEGGLYTAGVMFRSMSQVERVYLKDLLAEEILVNYQQKEKESV